MSRRGALLGVGLALTLGFAWGTAADDRLVLTNAQVYTVDAGRTWADAIAVDGDGIILAVGSTAEIESRYGEGIDLGGRMLLPGFQDAHVHAVEAGITAQFCLLPQFGAGADYRRALRACAAEQRDRPWVTAAGVNMVALLEAVEDPLSLIDAAIADRPAVVLDDLGHGAWTNSAGLSLAGFDRLAEDPRGGLLIRAADGGLSGVVLESASQTLIDAAQPATRANLDFALRSLAEALERFAENGITTVSDAGGYWPRGHEKVWQRAEAEGILTVRASNALYVYPERPPEAQIADLKARYSNDPERLVRFNQVKIYVDGILSQATGLLYAPYRSGPGLGLAEQLGFAYFPEGQLLRYARDLSAAGFQLHFHATGDRGAGLALDAIAGADPQSGPHRITHLYLVDPRDRARFAQLGVVADLQVAPSSLDPLYRDALMTLIGGRVDDLMPLRSLHDTGALVTLSSDWDSDELSPLVKLRTVLLREHEAAPDLATALEMMTINPARLLRHASRTGSIEPGKFADLVILERNLFDVPVEALGDVRVLATLLQGHAVYDPSRLFD